MKKYAIKRGGIGALPAGEKDTDAGTGYSVKPKKPLVVSRGDMALGSAKLNKVVGEGFSRARTAGRNPNENVPVSSQSGGSNLGSKDTPLLGRGNTQYKLKKKL